MCDTCPAHQTCIAYHISYTSVKSIKTTESIFIDNELLCFICGDHSQDSLVLEYVSSSSMVTNYTHLQYKFFIIETSEVALIGLSSLVRVYYCIIVSIQVDKCSPDLTLSLLHTPLVFRYQLQTR